MGDWNHYAFVKDASTGLLSIYCNGFLTAQSTNDFSPLDPPIKQLLIGNANYINYYYGRIDDFRIYDFALTQEEVISLPGVSDVAQDLLDRADITGDGRVGLPDFAVVAEQWLDTTGPPQSGNTYYVDSDLGNNNNDGLSEEQPWQTLAKVNSRVFLPGDKILFKADTAYLGQLKLAGGGEPGNPAIVDMYGDGNKPLIDGDGYLAALLLENVQYWEVSNLEIINDGATAKQPEAVDERYGVHIKAYNTGTRNHLYLRNLDVHHVFPETEESVPNEKGRGIAIESGGYALKTNYNDVLIEKCKVSITGNTGIWLHHKVWTKTSPYFAYNTNIIIRGNYLVDIGGPGFQPNHCKNVLIENNVVDGSGAKVDPRQKGRGSGIWPWKCEDVMIQNNLFMHARGIGDSCGAHVDVGNINTTIQYNLSYDNAGGFVEILGNCYNTIYRYNVSINDGWRIKGVDGAFQYGHMFWLGGWTGEDNPKQGPYDSKIYNNTVYLASGLQTRINVDDSAEDAFFTNNLIYIDGTVYDYNPDSTAVYIIFDNNLHNIALPATLPQTNEIIADPSLINPGGITTYDYRISAASVAIDNGV
ncbi:MAG: right-handed parallel beta-helix repeat-containing protein, partial [Planctomycetes bacterium]|nr:right-handed parallel beta-helix repeat-containing protein [Planctomycetota bacterium]